MGSGVGEDKGKGADWEFDDKIYVPCADMMMVYAV